MGALHETAQRRAAAMDLCDLAVRRALERHVLAIFPAVPAVRDADDTALVVDGARPAARVELSGAAAGRVLDGRSLTPLLADAHAPWNTATLLQCVQTRGLATRHCRYMTWPETDEVELYDMSADPYQLKNVAGLHKYAKIEGQLAEAFAALDPCGGSSCAWTGKFRKPPG